MIDIHTHIVPLVDDGPKSFEEVEDMLRVALSEGTTKMIASSHRNHPVDFKSKMDYESSFKKVKALVDQKFKGLEVYSGTELYIRDGYQDILDNMPYDFTLNKTRYVLIEFPYEVKYQSVSEAVYELVIRNYIPVLAHIERYSTLFEKMGRLETLRDEGAYIQISGEAITGKFGKNTMQDMKKLLKQGVVDFVASDTHSIERRRPSLKKAYETVLKYSDKTEADRIFTSNPEALLRGEYVEKKEVRKSIFDKLNSFRNKT